MAYGTEGLNPNIVPLDQPGILEVIVCSEADAVAAVEGGADRLEVISNYAVGGLTPSLELVRKLAATVRVPLRVMLRQSVPFVVRDPREIGDLCAAASALDAVGVEGVVIGFLQDGPRGKCIDHRLLERVLCSAPRLKATFHRAFEELHEPLEAIAELKHHPQIDRILTSGGSGTPAGKRDRLAQWRAAALSEIELVIGGGTDADTVRLLKPIGVREFHVGTAVRAGLTADGAVLVDRVRAIAKVVKCPRDH
ncbi:MAG: copper homeostasis protein CutC [Pirellulales bacterium]